MKIGKRLFCLILALCLSLPLAACGGTELEAPTGIDLSEEYMLSWDEMKNARSYEVEITDVASGQTNVDPSRRASYDLSALSEGDYSVRLRSVGGQGNNEFSEWTEKFDFHREYESGLIYSLINSDMEYAVIKVGKAEGDVVIEDTYRGRPVTAIADAAFRSAGGRVTSVTFGKNVRTIGDSAFYNCTGLTKVTMSDSVVSIGKSAFQNCGALESMTLSASLTTIPEYAFAYCKSLQTLALGDKITSIGESAFTNCSGLAQLRLPDSVATIGEYSFNENDALAEVTFGAGIRTIKGRAFYGCDALRSVVFPAQLAEGNSLSLGIYAFSNCDALETVELPEGTASIGEGCFSYSEQFDNIEIPASVESVGFGAFTETALEKSQEGNDMVYADHWLLSISPTLYLTCQTVDDTVLRPNTVGIADRAFIRLITSSDTGISQYSGAPQLERINLPSSVKYIGQYAFYNSPSLSRLHALNGGLRKIGAYAFAGCGVLSGVQFSEGLLEIGQYAFYLCTLLNNNRNAPHYLVPESVTRIGTYAFRDTMLWTSANDNDAVYAGNWVVGYKGAPTEITLREGNNAVEGISDYAFYNASTLRTVSNVQLARYVGVGAFYGCAALSAISLNRDLEKIGSYTFYGCAALWRVSLPTRLTEIGAYSFYNCSGLLRVLLSGFDFEGLDLSACRVRKIGERAFYGCEGLRGVRFGSMLESLGTRAFYGCTMLKEVTIPGTVKEIGEAAFAKSAVSVLTLENGIEKIGKDAFRMTSVAAVHIPDSVKEIGQAAFYDASQNLIIDLGNGVERIGDYAFGRNSGVVGNVTIPASVKEIGKYAFAECVNLGSVIFRGAPSSIGSNAFYLCSRLTFYVADGVELPGEGWNSSFRPEINGCTLSDDGTYVFSVTVGNIRYGTAFGGLTAPSRAGFDFVGWSTSPGGEPDYAAGDLASAPNGITLYAVYRYHTETPEGGAPSQE